MKVKYSEKLVMDHQKANVLSKSIKQPIGGVSSSNRYSQGLDSMKSSQNGYAAK